VRTDHAGHAQDAKLRFPWPGRPGVPRFGAGSQQGLRPRRWPCFGPSPSHRRAWPVAERPAPARRPGAAARRLSDHPSRVRVRRAESPYSESGGRLRHRRPGSAAAAGDPAAAAAAAGGRLAIGVGRPGGARPRARAEKKAMLIVQSRETLQEGVPSASEVQVEAVIAVMNFSCFECESMYGLCTTVRSLNGL
jgi:hypothetical protein